MALLAPVALALLLLVAAPDAAGAPSQRPGGPTDQLAVPGAEAGWEVTPEGYLYSGWAEVGWRYGPRLKLWDVRRRRLAEGRLPVVIALAEAGGVSYELRLFATGPPASPVAGAVLRARNVSRRPRLARWGLSVSGTGGPLRPDGTRGFRFRRPVDAAAPGLYNQPGERFAAGTRYAWDGGVLRRDGRALLRGPSTAERRTAGRPSAEDREGARAEHRIRLAPGAERRLTWTVALEPRPAPPPALQPTTAERGVRARWRALLARTTRVQLPESELEETWDTSLANLLMARSRTPFGVSQTVNRLNYHAFWLRDTAAIAHAYELTGLGRVAEQVLAQLDRFQTPDGLFISRPEQYDGWGQALWSWAEHVRRGGGMRYARRVLPAVDRAMGWLRRQRAQDPLGLLPVNGSADNEDVAAHRTGDALWAVLGAEGAADIARAGGDVERADRYGAEARALRAAVRAAGSAAAARNGGVLPPALDAPGGYRWGELWLAWPSGVWAPRHPLVGRTLRSARRTWREGIATYGRNLHGYLGFRVLQTHLLRGETAEVVDGLRAHVAHATTTHGGCEFCGAVGAPRLVYDNLTPHGWWAAEYLALLRNMLVREVPGGLRVLSALPGEWLRPGRTIAIRRAPTLAGPVSVALRTVRGGAVLTWSDGTSSDRELAWPLPRGVDRVRARGLDRERDLIVLPERATRLRVSWRLRP